MVPINVVYNCPEQHIVVAIVNGCRMQGRHGKYEPDKAQSTVVGIICPPG